MSAEALHDEPLLIRYLLGSLPAEEAERLDELSITDDNLAWRLKSAENDMVDAYVRGELSGETLDRFTSVYLATPARREKVEFARTLMAVLGGGRAPRSQGWLFGHLAMPRWAVACAAGIAAIAAGFLINQQQRLQSQVEQLRTSGAALQAHERELQKKLEQLASSASPPAGSSNEAAPDAGAMLAVLLPPPARNAARPPIVRIPARTARVAIDMQLEDNDIPIYRVALKDVAGSRILWAGADLKAQTRDRRAVVAIVLPAPLLKPGRYLLELSSGGAPGVVIGNYVFEVVI